MFTYRCQCPKYQNHSQAVSTSISHSILAAAQIIILYQQWVIMYLEQHVKYYFYTLEGKSASLRPVLRAKRKTTLRLTRAKKFFLPFFYCMMSLWLSKSMSNVFSSSNCSPICVKSVKIVHEFFVVFGSSLKRFALLFKIFPYINLKTHKSPSFDFAICLEAKILL